MPDREKIIGNLELIKYFFRQCRKNFSLGSDVENSLFDLQEAASGAITLLKKQESIIKSLESDLHETLEVVSGRLNVVRCKDCKHYKDGFCYNPNTYDDEKTRGNTVPDWFCADGERRGEMK